MRGKLARMLRRAAERSTEGMPKYTTDRMYKKLKRIVYKSNFWHKETIRQMKQNGHH